MSKLLALSAATLIIWGGIFLYMWRLDRRLDTIEKNR